MAQVTYVKKAQARYKMVPVIDPATGEQKVTPVMRADGTPKVTKHGHQVVMRQTVADRTQPLPPLVCEFCNEPIEVGTPYKHVSPKSGPYGGYQRNRHKDCPGWQAWDLTNAWWARIARATSGFDVSEFMDNPDESSVENIRGALEQVADEVRGLAEESRETASNIEQGFGHSTQQSQEAEDRADALEAWADEIAEADLPDFPEAETETETRWFVINVDGSGDVAEDTPEGFDDEAEARRYMNGIIERYPQAKDDMELESREVEVTGDEPTEEQIENWRSEVESAIGIVDESPV
jgi:hypothetical protein